MVPKCAVISFTAALTRPRRRCQRVAANGSTAPNSTRQGVRLQAQNMEMDQHPCLGLLEVAMGQRHLVPLPFQVLM